MTTTICFAGEKGGVGKTLLAGNVAASLAKRGHTVFMIDMDPQGNLTTWFLGETNLQPSVYDFLKGKDLMDIALKCDKETMAIVRSHCDDLVAGEREFSANLAALFFLKKAIARESDRLDIDFFLIDTPPNLSMLTSMSLTASDYVFLPVVPEHFSMHGLKRVLQTIEDIQENFNPNLKVGGIVVNKYDQRRRLNKDTLRDLRKIFKKEVCKQIVRDNVYLAEATSEFLSISHYKKRSYGAEDFKKLGKEILERIGYVKTKKTKRVKKQIG